MHALRQLVSAAANINRPASQHEPADDASTVASIVAMVFGVIVVTVVLGVIFGPMVSPWWYAKPTRGYVQVMQVVRGQRLQAGDDERPTLPLKVPASAEDAAPGPSDGRDAALDPPPSYASVYGV